MRNGVPDGSTVTVGIWFSVGFVNGIPAWPIAYAILKYGKLKMARKSKRDKGQHIDRLREKAGYASDRFDWKNKTGNSFRQKGQNSKQFPQQRPADIFK